jgi:hypothetical protein
MRVRGNIGLFLVQQLLGSTLFSTCCRTAPYLGAATHTLFMHCRTAPYLGAVTQHLTYALQDSALFRRCNTALTWALQHGALLWSLGEKKRVKKCHVFSSKLYFCIITFLPVIRIFWNVLHEVKESPSS